ncbi:MAG: hypothetical protein FK734_06585 [Asgard group archaeon]|nr:hypothetical protein [Asgard group archaeon]
MKKEKNKQKSNDEKISDNEQIDTNPVEEPNENQLRTDDLEVAERVKVQQKIKGISRVMRAIERDPKETITKFDRKIFDAGFMQMHTSEFTYRLLRDELKKYGIISDLVAEVNAGKEASIYIAHLHGSPLVVKAFRLQQTCHNQSKGNPQLRMTSIAVREYDRLTRAYNAGMNVPTPARQINNTIIMSFIGKNWNPAPQLRNIKLQEPEKILDDIIEELKLMYTKAKLIHGDLSEYNILIHDNKPVIIDFPQAIDMSLYHMRFTDTLKSSLKVLQKDVNTIKKYFEKEYHISFDFNEVYSYIVGKDANLENVNYSIDDIEKMIGLKTSEDENSKNEYVKNYLVRN